jgi:hypothetical protein
MCDITVARNDLARASAVLVLACILFSSVLAQPPAALAQGPGEFLALVPVVVPPQLTPQSIITWTNGSSGFWDVGANWSSGTPPGPDDHAVINEAASPSFTVTVRYSITGTTVGSLDCTRRLEVASTAKFTVTSASLISGTTSDTGLTLKGTLNAPGGLTVGGVSQVKNGIVAGVVTNTGRMSLDGVVYLQGRLDNAGTLVHNSGTLWLSGSPGITATLNNLAAAVYDSQADTSVYIGNAVCGLECPQVVNNWGTLRKSGGGGTSELVMAGGSSVLNDAGGVMEAITGTFYIGAPGLRTGTTFNASSGAVVLLAGPGDADYAGTIGGTGLGQVRVQGTALRFHDAFLNFSPGLLYWSGVISGTVTNLGALTLNSGVVVGTLNNAGVTVHQGTNPLALGSTYGVATTLNNLAGGLYEFTGDGGIGGFCTVCPPRSFNNWGVLRKSGGAGTSLIRWDVPFQNGGAVEALSGRLAIATSFVSTGTVTVASGAELEVDTTMTLQGGSLTGNGTVIGNVVNVGVVSPGASPGLLTINGNYVQSPTGTLRLEIGGLAPGTQFDQLATAYSTLDGALEITFTNGFVPNWGDVFPILGSTAGRSGTFATVSAPLVSATVAYGPEWVYLMAGQVADLAVTVTDNRTAILPGLSDTYTATLSNNGPADVVGGIYTVTLPTAWDPALAAAGLAPAAHQDVLRPAWSYTDTLNLSAGEIITLTFQGTYVIGVTGPQTVTVGAAPPSGVHDPILANNTATDIDVAFPPVFLPLVTKVFED